MARKKKTSRALIVHHKKHGTGYYDLESDVCSVCGASVVGKKALFGPCGGAAYCNVACLDKGEARWGCKFKIV